MEATAKFDFEAKAEDDLSFKRGDCLKVRITHTHTDMQTLPWFVFSNIARHKSHKKLSAYKNIQMTDFIYMLSIKQSISM